MYSDIAKNKRRTIFIMFIFILFVVAMLFIFTKAFNYSYSIFIGGTIGALIYTLITYYAGSNMALAVNRASELNKRDNIKLYRTVENLCIADGLPMPKIYIMDDPAPNAFATGRDPKHAYICVTTGLLEIMNSKELEGVIAHELSHIKNLDVRVNMIAFALTAVISLIADIVIRLVWFNDRENENNQVFLALGIIAAILAPFIALFIQLAISRQREYLADASGALVTRYPEGLAEALEKIKNQGSSLKFQNTATAHLFFANPLKKHSLSSLFSTHPPIDDRIKRLRKMDLHS